MHRVYYWCRSKLNRVSSHMHVWQHLADFQQTGGNLCNVYENRVKTWDWSFLTGSAASLCSFVWRRLTPILLPLTCWQLFGVKLLREMLVVNLPCAVARKLRQQTDALLWLTLSSATGNVMHLPALTENRYKHYMQLHLTISSTWI